MDSYRSIDVVLENQALKQEFSVRGLKLSQVFSPVSNDLARENGLLRNLLDWVDQYRACRNRKKMEALGYFFPPITAEMGPNEDWAIFEKWATGKMVKKKIKDWLPKGCAPKRPENLSDEEVAREYEKLERDLEALNISICFTEQVPVRLAYEKILEDIEEEEYESTSGTWVFNGCSGYCPGCFQRPWCEIGADQCWPEDEEAGEMFLIDSVRRYVSPSPGSLELLREV